MTDFLKDTLKALANPNAHSMDKDKPAKFHIDTGSYILNALISGSIYKGIPSNSVTAFAGAQATGKTFFALSTVEKFLDKHKDGLVFYFESEKAISKDMLEERDIDVTRVIKIEIATVEEFRHQGVTIAENYKKQSESERRPILVVLDSLGNLGTNKEFGDAIEGKNTQDMTRTRLIKSAFRVLTLKFGQLDIPMVVNNHTYKSMSLFPTDEVAGGGGIKYCASTIVLLAKRKDKDGTELVGNFIGCKLYKSRLTKEGQRVDVHLSFEDGLNRYYGLLDVAERAEIFKKSGNKYIIGDKTYFGKAINKNPEKFFTEEIMKQIEEFIQKDFRYGSATPQDEKEVEDVQEEAEETTKE